MAKEIVLGIETSCDDTSVAILQRTDSYPVLLAYEKFNQEMLLKKWGGVVPEIAARNHLEKIGPLLAHSFKTAGLKSSDIDLIGVTTHPGLLGPLLTGLNAAKTYALLNKTPMIAVNHLYAHLEAIHMDQEVAYPYLGLLVSGGHTIFFWVQSENNFHVIGSTIDDAAGEAFDKGGKMLGLGYPAGQIIDEIAVNGDETAFEFSIGMKSSKDARMSFSGLKTALRVELEKDPNLKKQDSQRFKDLVASYQKAIVKSLTFKTKYAVMAIREKFNFNGEIPIVIGGGVACNSKLRLDFQNSKWQSYFVTPKYCTDNGAMIANFALRNFNHKIDFPKCLDMDAKGRFIDKKDFLNG
jgi:N6-L-threonylcarbamoyladenine synthase